MAVLKLLLPALLLGAAQAHADEESVGLLQRKADADDCKCLNWAETYKAHRMGCGNGHEYKFLPKAAAVATSWTLKHEFCEHFFQRIQSNFCVKKKFNTNSTEQWCFVSDRCGKGEKVGKPLFRKQPPLKAKTCDEAEDDLLSGYSPEKLFETAKELDLDLGIMAKYAYPNGGKWPKAVDSFIPNNNTIVVALSKLPGLHTTVADEEARRVKASKIPTLYDSVTEHPPFNVVFGDKVYEIAFTAWAKHQLNFVGDIFEKPGKINELLCLHGPCGH